MYSLIFVGITAFLLCLVLTPIVRNLSRRWGLVDHPDTPRKLHTVPIPRIGGIAVAIAYMGSVALLLALPLNAGELVVKGLPFVWQLLPAAIVIFGTGLCDDLFGLRPWEKILGQIAAAGSAYWAGVHINMFAGHQVDTWWNLPLTIIWLVGCTNAINLIDGVDGLATGVGLFATCTTLLAALLQDNVALALATAPLVGALLGFLRYNFNPATIFLGDSGSLFLGFLLGCYGVLWSQKSATILGMTAPLMALSIPLLDTGLAIARRFLRHKPIFTADRGHIHHRLLDRGFTPRKVALLLYGCCAMGALCSLAVMYQHFSGLIIILFCVTTWIGIQHLGYVEFGVAGRMFVEGAFRRLLTSHITLSGFEQSLAAAPTPDVCWSVIQDSSREFGFHHIKMRLAGHTFEHRNGIEEGQFWTIRVPISDADYVELTREFGASADGGAVAAFADVLRTTLARKLGAFEAKPKPAIRATESELGVSKEAPSADGRFPGRKVRSAHAG